MRNRAADAIRAACAPELSHDNFSCGLTVRRLPLDLDTRCLEYPCQLSLHLDQRFSRIGRESHGDRQSRA
jgi:hypothetical protein